MLVALPVFSGDVSRLLNLLVWIKQLGGCSNHDAVIIADAETPAGQVLHLKAEALKSFSTVHIVTNESKVFGWIKGANSLFIEALRFAYTQDKPWLFLESDAIPLCPGWIDAIEIRYRSSGKRYMGALVQCKNPELPPIHMPGVSVYPPNAYDELAHVVARNQNVAFDLSIASITVPQAEKSDAFQHLWGEMNNPPTFADVGVPGTGTFGLDFISPKAVLFHRSKDGTLIRLLQKRMGLQSTGEMPIAVVLPFCQKDSNLMVNALSWMTHLHPKLERTCVLHFDSSPPQNHIESIRRLAGELFMNVAVSRYQNPKPPWIGWPAACNWSFRHACDFVATNLKQPFLWMEPDMVALKPDWIFQIEREYHIGGKPFMGTVIGDFDGLKMGHINGTAVYPPNACDVIKRSLANPHQAWDTGMKPDMITQTHQSNHIMQHCGAVVNKCCKPANGALPTFNTQSDVDNLVIQSAVTFHPSKDGTLTQRLFERSTQLK